MNGDLPEPSQKGFHRYAAGAIGAMDTTFQEWADEKVDWHELLKEYLPASERYLLQQVPDLAQNLWIAAMGRGTNNAEPKNQYFDLVDGLLKDESGPTCVHDCLECELEGIVARTLLSIGYVAVDRISTLIALTRTPENRGKVHDFLKRACLLYLLGFDNECIVMCRAVIDVATASSIPPDDCVRYRGPRNQRHDDDSHPYTLEERIDVAVQSKRISPQMGKMAHNVRIAGNRAVHQKPTPRHPESAKFMLMQTRFLLDTLLPEPPGE